MIVSANYSAALPPIIKDQTDPSFTDVISMIAPPTPGAYHVGEKTLRGFLPFNAPAIRIKGTDATLGIPTVHRINGSVKSASAFEPFGTIIHPSGANRDRTFFNVLSNWLSDLVGNVRWQVRRDILIKKLIRITFPASDMKNVFLFSTAPLVVFQVMRNDINNHDLGSSACAFSELQIADQDGVILGAGSQLEIPKLVEGASCLIGSFAPGRLSCDGILKLRYANGSETTKVGYDAISWCVNHSLTDTPSTIDAIINNIKTRSPFLIADPLNADPAIQVLCSFSYEVSGTEIGKFSDVVIFGTRVSQTSSQVSNLLPLSVVASSVSIPLSNFTI